MAELRKDPVTERWVIIATERGKRPFDFVSEDFNEGDASNCPFCYGNENKTPSEILAIRPKGTSPNSTGWTVRDIPNKYPALNKKEPLTQGDNGFYSQMTGFGIHEVVVESPDHFKKFQDLSNEEIQDVLKVFQARIKSLYEDERNQYVLIFKNEGPQAGASLSHTHSQIIATPIIPKRVLEELDGVEVYRKNKQGCLFCDMIEEEKKVAKRIIYENEYYISFCPYASRFPFEICFLPKYHQKDFYESSEHLEEMTEALRITLSKLSSALKRPQYNFIIHTSPNSNNPDGSKDRDVKDYHWHFEIMPRLTKVAGFEWGSGFYINPTPPEEAAEYMREAKQKLQTS